MQQAISVSFAASSARSGSAWALSIAADVYQVTGAVVVGAATAAWQVSGDIELLSKPTWAIDDYPAFLSEDVGAGLVVLKAASGSGDQIIPGTGADEILRLDTAVIDTNSAVDLSGNKIIIPETGYYFISGAASFKTISVVGSSLKGKIAVGGSGVTAYRTQSSTTSFTTVLTDTTMELTKDDEITFIVTQNSGSNQVLNSGPADCFLSVTKVQSPQQIAAGEKVACTMAGSDGGSLTTNNLHFIGGGTAVIDTHGRFISGITSLTDTLSDGWECPRTDIYSVSSLYQTLSTTWVANATIRTYIEVSGVQSHYRIDLAHAAFTGSVSSSLPSRLIKINKGDIVRWAAVVANNMALPSSADRVYLSIHSIG